MMVLKKSRRMLYLLISWSFISASVYFVFGFPCDDSEVLSSICPSKILSSQSLTEKENLLPSLKVNTSLINDSFILCSHYQLLQEHRHLFFHSSLIKSPSIDAAHHPLLNYSYSQWKSSSIIPRAFTPCEHSLMMILLQLFDQVCRDNHIEYFIGDGTLLGSLRHHDIIPWDTDADVWMPFDKRLIFANAIQRLNSTLIQYYPRGGSDPNRAYCKLSFFPTPFAGRMPWHFPFLDIFYYRKNETHVWSTDHDNYLATDVYPLMMRPLGSLWFPAPRNGFIFLNKKVLQTCRLHSYDHRAEKSHSALEVPCENLTGYYPFVYRNQSNPSIEILKLNNTLIQTIQW